MAEKLTINDFVAWVVSDVDRSALSELMTRYGYTDDSQESIIDALRRYPDFIQELATLHGYGYAQRITEVNRAIGGIRMVDDKPTVEDWHHINRKTRLTLAAGTTTAEDNQTWWDKNGTGLVNTFLAITGTTLSSIFGNGTAAAQAAAAEQENKTSGTSLFLYIVIGVVILAVIAILWMSLSGQRK